MRPRFAQFVPRFRRAGWLGAASAALLLGLLAGCVPQSAQKPAAPVSKEPEQPKGPAAPGAPAAKAGEEQVVLSWPSVQGAESYNVYWLAATGVTPANGNRIAGVTSPYTHDNRHAGQTYYYVVTAVQRGVEGAPSPVAASGPVAAKSAQETRAVAESGPAELTAKPGDREVTLTWQSVTGAESYNLYWLAAPGVAPDSGNRIVGAKSPFTHKDLANGVGYHYRVTAVKAGKESVPSPAASATPSAPKAAVLSPDRPEIRAEDFVAVLVKAGDTLASLAEKYLGSKDKSWMLADFNGVSEAQPGMELIVPLKPFDRGGLSPGRYRSVPVLTYHNLSKTESNIMTVQDTAFEAQMQYLKENDYRVITLNQFYDFVKFNAPIPEKSVIITFDDGWRSTYEIGLPILKKFGFPATLFIYTDFVGQSPDKSLTWEMVQELQAGSVDIQCHSKSHRDLTQMNPNEQFEQYYNALNLEMSLPNNMVMEKLKRRCDYLAYPYGATNRLVASLAEKHGYRLAFTVNRGSAAFFQDLYRIDRSMIYGSHDLKKFEQNLAQYRSEALQ